MATLEIKGVCPGEGQLRTTLDPTRERSSTAFCGKCGCACDYNTYPDTDGYTATHDERAAGKFAGYCSQIRTTFYASPTSIEPKSQEHTSQEGE